MAAMESVEVAGLVGGVDRHTGKAGLFEIDDSGETRDHVASDPMRLWPPSERQKEMMARAATRISVA